MLSDWAFFFFGFHCPEIHTQKLFSMVASAVLSNNIVGAVMEEEKRRKRRKERAK